MLHEHNKQLQVLVELQLVISEAEAYYTHVASLISQQHKQVMLETWS